MCAREEEVQRVGSAAAATWISCGDEERRGWDADVRKRHPLRYSPNQAKQTFENERWCFKTALLGNAHTHSAELLFHKSTASSAKKQMWADYRDKLLETFCPACRFGARPRPLAGKGCRRDLDIIVTRRTHDPNSSSFLFANGRGRRIVNEAQLVKGLGAFGRVRAVDPGLLSLKEQMELAADADVLVSRVSSQVVLSMFMKPGGLAVEVEAPDPAKLYYDHHAAGPRGNRPRGRELDIPSSARGAAAAAG